MKGFYPINIEKSTKPTSIIFTNKERSEGLSTKTSFNRNKRLISELI